MAFTNFKRVRETTINPLIRAFKDGYYSGTAWFTVSSVLKSLIQILSSFIVARMVLPEDIGIWKSVLLIQTYINILHTGISEGLNRQYALYQGSGETEKALDRAQVAFSYMLLVSILSAVIVLAIAAISWQRGSDQKVIVALVLLALHAIATPLWNYYDVLFRSGQSFTPLAWIQLWEAVYMMASIVLVYLWDWQGMLVRFGTIIPFGVILRLLLRPIPIQIKMNWETLKELLSVGWKVVVSAYLHGLFMVADITLIAAFMGQEAVGIYSIAVTIAGALEVFPNTVKKVVFSLMTYRYGQSGNAASLGRLAFLPVLYSAVLLFFPLAILWFVIDPFIRSFLPNYSAGIMAAKWMLVTVYFMGLKSSVSVLRTLNRMRAEIILTAVSLGLIYLLGWISIQRFQTLESISIVKALVMLFLTVGLNIASYQLIKHAPTND